MFNIKSFLKINWKLSREGFVVSSTCSSLAWETLRTESSKVNSEKKSYSETFTTQSYRVLQLIIEIAIVVLTVLISCTIRGHPCPWVYVLCSSDDSTSQRLSGHGASRLWASEVPSASNYVLGRPSTIWLHSHITRVEVLPWESISSEPPVQRKAIPITAFPEVHTTITSAAVQYMSLPMICI